MRQLACRALRAELRVYSSIGRAIARRPAVERGGTGIGHHRPTLTVLIVFIVLSAVEIPILDLITHRVPWLRIACLILGIWGVTWMVGLLCAMLMRPHAVGPSGIRVRNGLEVDVPISWDDIAEIRVSRRTDQPKSPRISADDAGAGEYAERVQYETNIVVELEAPITVRLPGDATKSGTSEVVRVRLWADDPQRFIASARPFLEAHPARDVTDFTRE